MSYASHLTLVEDVDPRPNPTDEPLAAPADDLRPAVANARPSSGPWLIVGVAALLAIVVLFWLSLRRNDGQETPLPEAPVGVSTAPSTAPTLPPDLLLAEAGGRLAPPAPSLQFGPDGLPLTSAPTTLIPPANAPASGYAPMPAYVPAFNPAPLSANPAAAPDALQRRRAPVLVVDLAPAGAQAAEAAAAPGTLAALAGQAAAQAAGQATGQGAAAEAAGQGASGSLSGDEQFAERVGSGQPDRARATMLRNPQSVVPQGATITAVLETALNSDLPGFARAVVSRDVRSFDGQSVLIPRGSRVIGQYRSGVATGQSRAFVIWTRVLRPDGASVQIGSSAADPLGRVGLEGEVDRRFFQRFGGSALLSVINGGITALTGRPSTQIVIGSGQQAAGLAAFATPKEVPPTIRVAQGTPIRIFVARDLDFTAVGGR